MAARKRDTEAISVAEEIADSVHASPDGRSTGILVGARAYRRGEAKAREREVDLEAEIRRLRLLLKKTEARAQGWTPAEVSYIHTLKTYGMKLADIADVMGVGIDAVQHALRLAKDKYVRKKADRAGIVPGKRSVDVE